MPDEYGHLFNDTDIDSHTPIDGKVNVKKNKQKVLLIKRENELKKVMPQIKKQHSYHLISNENFGSIELMKVIIEREKPDYIMITTWSINQNFVYEVQDYLKAGGKMLFIVDRSLKTRKAHLYAQMVTLAQENPKQLKTRVHFMIHCKVTLYRTKDKHLTVESSANYSNNTRIEQFTITDSEDLYNFHHDWIDKIVGK